MKVLSVEQNTQEWLEQRKKLIGGSDVPIIMGVSPWKTPLQLWEEKTGKRMEDTESKKFIFQKGHRLEDRARKILELKTGVDFPPKVVRHSELEYCQVSLDGLSLDNNAICEIKYVGEETYDRCLDEDYVPEHYYPQLQYQMLATGLEENLFVAYSEKRDEIKTILVPVDKDYIRNMIKVCNKFYSNLIEGVAPEVSQKDYVTVKRKVMLEAMAYYSQLDKEAKKIKTKMDEAKSLINEMAVEYYPKASRFTGAGLKVFKTQRQGTIDWKKVQNVHDDIDFESFRKPSTESVTFKVEGENGKRKEKRTSI